jgi:hypothetical protein
MDQDTEIARAAAEVMRNVPASMMHISVQQLLNQLVEQSAEVPDHDPEPSRLDSIIIRLPAP